MAQLKLDLLNKLNNDKYLEEEELVRLHGESMNYKKKLEKISDVLKNIAIINIQLGLTEQYFRQEPTGMEEEK